jgi:hypothetical protein
MLDADAVPRQGNLAHAAGVGHRVLQAHEPERDPVRAGGSGATSGRVSRVAWAWVGALIVVLPTETPPLEATCHVARG